jgi:hypothetical protein
MLFVGILSIFVPSRIISPSSIFIDLEIAFIRVDFPDPFGPIIVTISPLFTSRQALLTAILSPYLIVMLFAFMLMITYPSLK